MNLITADSVTLSVIVPGWDNLHLQYEALLHADCSHALPRTSIGHDQFDQRCHDLSCPLGELAE